MMQTTETALTVLSPFPAPLQRTDTAAKLVAAFLAGRNERTLRAYGQDLEDFRTFLDAPNIDEAARILVSSGHGDANAIALAYRAHLIERKLQAATINRRLAAVRSLVKLARTLGIIPWALDIANLKAQPYRDTRGPGRQGFRDMLNAVVDRTDGKALRDRSLLRLLHDLALRRAEVTSLDLADVDLEAGTVAIMGKGRTQKQTLTLPEPTKGALSAWVATRGSEAGPLFLNFDRAGKGQRLTGSGLYALVRTLGKTIGIVTRPHGLRHAGITEALDLTNGNTRAVQKYSRHKDIRVLAAYDDNRTDLGGDIARLVAANI
jgi:integrase/recombinase XerC